MRKGIRVTVYVVFALTVLYFVVEWFLEAKIRYFVEKKVEEVSRGAVRAEIGSVSLRLIGRSLWLEEVKISSDTVALRRSGWPLKRVEGYFDRLGARGVHFRKRDSLFYLRARELDAGISRLAADILKPGPGGRSAARTLAGVQVEVETVSVRLDRMYCRVIEGRDSVDYRLNGFSGKVTDGEFRTFPAGKGWPFACGDIQLALSSFQCRFAEGSSLLEVDSLRWQGDEERFTVGALRLLPQYGMYEFARKSPGHADWTRIEAAGLEGTGVDWRRFMAERWIDVDSLSFGKLSVRNFKNRQIEQTPRVKRLFYQSVQEFPFPLSVRRIALQHADVEYLELAKHGSAPGRITFNGLQGMFYGLTNRGTAFTVKAKGKLMNQGEMQAVFRLPAGRSNPFFEVEGRLGAMNLAALNPMTEPLAKVKIASGRVEGMTFSMKGDAQRADADVLFLYEKLRIRIMKEKDGHLETRSFLTTLANGLIVRENNPGSGVERKVCGSAERDPYRSQFNYLWKTLFSGLKKSVGL